MFLSSAWPTRLVLLACLFLQACSKPVPAEEPVRAVKIITVGLDAMQSGAEYAGEVRSRVESRLGFRVSGKLLRRNVELGQHVRAGEVLAQLDPQDFKLAADGARAQLAAAATNRDLALADYKRYKDLREQNFISAAELERRDTALKAAQAQVDQAQAQLARRAGGQINLPYRHLRRQPQGIRFRSAAWHHQLTTGRFNRLHYSLRGRGTRAKPTMHRQGVDATAYAQNLFLTRQACQRLIDSGSRSQMQELLWRK